MGFLSGLHVEPFVPTPDDVRQALFYLSSPGMLPTELAIAVLDLAEYWPVEISESHRHQIVRAGVDGSQTQATVLVSQPILGGGDGGLAKCVRRINITTESRDQGFSSFPQYHNTREGSSSWFEVALIRLSTPSIRTTPSPPPSSSPLPPSPTTVVAPLSVGSPASAPHVPHPPAESVTPASSSAATPAPTWRVITRRELLRNLHAVRTFTSETSIFTAGDKIVDLAQVGDRIIVYGLALYPAWVNEVRGCRIEVEVSV